MVDRGLTGVKSGRSLTLKKEMQVRRSYLFRYFAETSLRVPPLGFCLRSLTLAAKEKPCTLLRQHSPRVLRAAGSGEADCRTRDPPVTAAAFRP